MNSFEENIKKQQLLQKSFAETFTGQNEVFKIIEALKKAGVPEDEMIEKAKYIRREGAPGNYKYICEEPKSNFGDSGKKDKKPSTPQEHAFERKYGKKEENKTVDYKVGQRVSVAGWNNDSGKFNNWDDAGMAVITDTSKLSDGEITVRYLDDPEAGVNTIDVDHIRPWGKSQKQKSQSSDLQKAEQTEAQKAKIAKVMREFKEGKLKSSSGAVVKDKEQAIAIALSEAGLSKK